MRLRATSLFVSLMLVIAAPSAFADEGDEGDDGAPKSSTMKVEMLADFIAGDSAEADGGTALADASTAVADFRISGMGWGALFKIYALAAVLEVPASDLLGAIGSDGDFEFSFGELKNGLTEDQRAAFDEMPKNFGTLMADAMRTDKATDKAAAAEERNADKKAERDARKEARDAAKAERESDGGEE